MRAHWRRQLWIPLAAALVFSGPAAPRRPKAAPSDSAPAQQTKPAARTERSFAATVAALSEPAGYFNTDNLISNERSYLHVVPELRALAGPPGGAYIGVGPDQNFSYIAHVRPAVAILIDIRRDNLLLHLLFKALFAEARTRVEYLALLTGRAPPQPATGWDQRPIDAIVAYIDSAKLPGDAGIRALRDRLTRTIDAFGVPLTNTDRATIEAFHRRFIADGLSLRFNTTGRAPQPDYPTYRDLLVEVDRQGKPRNFLASESDFQFVRGLQMRDLVIPIVGDLSGSTAVAAVAKHLEDSQRQVTAFYTSNVEFYLFREGRFPQFVANLARLPRRSNSLIVRSVFPTAGAGAVRAPGYNSASMTQQIQVLVDGWAKGGFREYWELISRSKAPR